MVHPYLNIYPVEQQTETQIQNIISKKDQLLIKQLIHWFQKKRSQ